MTPPPVSDACSGRKNAAGQPNDRGRAEDKPAWHAVPRAVRSEVEEALGARVARAVRAWGGYAPSATFRLALADGRRAFFKAAYPLPADSPVVFPIPSEERVYRELEQFISPWAPRYLGSVQHDGWHGILLEDLGPATVPPWTLARAQAAMRAFGEFHRASAGRALPDWVRRTTIGAGSWAELREREDGAARLAAMAGEREPEATAWVQAHLDALDEKARRLRQVEPPFALLHLDTRSDNVRVHPHAAVPLRIFDWPMGCSGAPELDMMAFAQSIACEGGPAPEQLAAWYAEAYPVRQDALAASACAVAGFFALRAPQPEVPALPRLRSIQRRQLKASLGWAARLLALPEPGWLAAVPD